MKFITVSGIDKSGKTTFINEFMKVTKFKHFIVDRDPSNWNALNIIQNRWGCTDQIEQYKKFVAKFRDSVDLAILLVASTNVLEERFVTHNEPKLVGEYNMFTHQKIITQEFKNVGYKNTLIIDTGNINLQDMIENTLTRIGE